MRFLLDSHAYLWWLSDDRRLGAKARGAIADPASEIHVSAASIWELAIKSALGRLNSGGADLVAEIVENGFTELPITAAHAAQAGALPRHHDDPFDRMIIAQAQIEQLICLTRDSIFASYGVKSLW